MTEQANKYPRKLRNGRAVRVLATDGANPAFPIVIDFEDGGVGTRTKDGRCYLSEESPYDLMPETKTVKFWVAHSTESDKMDMTYSESIVTLWHATGQTVTEHTAEIEV